MASIFKGAVKTITDKLAEYVLSPGDVHGFREGCVVCKAADTHLSHHVSEAGRTPAGGSEFLSLSVTREDPVMAVCL